MARLAGWDGWMDGWTGRQSRQQRGATEIESSHIGITEVEYDGASCMQSLAR
jgi:hypothetical protein